MYVASIGYADCDPFASFAGMDADSVERECQRAIEQEYVDYRNSYCEADCADDCEHVEAFDMWATPAFSEPTLSAVRAIKAARGHLYSTDMDDLRYGVLAF